MVYYFYHCISLHVCPGVNFILDSPVVNVSGKKLSFWLSACSGLIMVPLLYVRPSFPSKSSTEGIR